MKKSVSFLLGILFTILIVFLFYYARNVIILNSLNAKAIKTRNIENYTIHCTSYADTTYSIVESYHMKDKYTNTHTTYYTASNQLPSSICVYKDKDSSISVYTRDAVSVVKSTEEPFGLLCLSNDLQNQNLFSLAMQNITREKCNEKDCYSFVIQQVRYWIDIETGLTIRTLNLQEYKTHHSTIITDYNYTFDNVTDNNIVKPDIANAIVAPY